MPEATQKQLASTTNGSDPMPPTSAHQNGHANGNDGLNGHANGNDGLNGHANRDASLSTAPAHSSPDEPVTNPKKRRKVNHACVYCRRSHMTCDLERPCTRCIKRNIGHLCHDEPREPAKRSKAELDHSTGDDGAVSPTHTRSPAPDTIPASSDPRSEQQHLRDADASLEHGPAPNDRVTSAPEVVQPLPISGVRAQAIAANNNSVLGYPDWSSGTQSQFQDMHTFHPSYMFNAPEVTNEYNLLNDFLSNSLLDDGALYSGEDGQGIYSDPSLLNTMPPPVNTGDASLLPNQHSNQSRPPSRPTNLQGPSISRPTSTVPTDKARETYYMTAADPSGSDPPEERMNKLLKAKYDAGLLKPFNYVKGYARLSHYMEQNMPPASRQKILRQLDQFRPKFRERMQKLTDIELVLVEMWFERSLMEYDRVFASMAIPACCWRRTGEIFRGNKEMAELIHVPIEKLRDGKIAIHEILENDSIVSYWEKFGTIAFDNTQKAMLTSCFLKNPDPRSDDPNIHCCFSFTIRRDSHNIPSIIVGNFLPMDPVKR